MISKASFQRRLTSNKLGKVTISKPVLIAASNKRLERTRRSVAFISGCVGELLKRSVMLLPVRR